MGDTAIPLPPPRTDLEPVAARPRPESIRRVAFLGTGYIADWHAKAIASLDGVELVAVCDKIVPRARALAARLGLGLGDVYGSLEEMLAAERLDAVHVLTPPDAHFEVSRAILDAGVHVFLEKPMCSRAVDCDALVRLAEERGLTVAVGHNFLFSEPYQRLRRDLRDGVLGPLDHLTITWHRELPQVTHGPFDLWMLREPGNIMLEVGSHCVAQVLDLLGPPDEIHARATTPIELPTGRTFYRRWEVSAQRGRTAVDLRFSFVPGFGEYTIHARGALASATVDFERNTYVLRRHRPYSEDFDRCAIALGEARSLRRQARRTLLDYVLSKFHLHRRGSPYAGSIAGALHAFYGALGAPLDDRIRARTGAEVLRVCEQIARSAAMAQAPSPPPSVVQPPAAAAPRILVLGATGFIGRELSSQLARSGRAVRVLVRSPSKLAPELRTAAVECVRGDLTSEADLRQAMGGIDCVVHLARASVKTWAEYQEKEIGVTRRIAESALAAGVKRFLYTGTIDSYYAGARAGVITEATPLDRKIARRNLYARAKAASEELLLELHRERGLPLVILRPGIVIGRGSSPFHWGVGMWWHGAVCQTWGSGRTPLPLVLVEDVAQALVAALDVPGIEGESFNLVADPCLTAQEYLDELDRAAGMRIQRHATPIAQFYAVDTLKWLVKLVVRHPDRRRPSYHDWESRTQRAIFDCSRTKARLGWEPVSERAEMVRRGIRDPLAEILR